jgi:List-Bact-rpt repeat protein
MQSRPPVLRLIGVVSCAALFFALCTVESGAAPSSARLLIRTSGGAVTAIGGGVRFRCSATCLRVVRSNAIVRLIAIPEPGRVFLRWSGSCVGTAPRCLLIIDGSKSVRALFAPVRRTTAKRQTRLAEVNVTVSGPGAVVGGPQKNRISCFAGSPVVAGCHGSFKRGTTLMLRARPNRGHRFVLWRAGTCGARLRCQLHLRRSALVIAAFRR